MCKDPNCILRTCRHPTCNHVKLFEDYGVFTKWKYVNINGCDTQGVAIKYMCNGCLPYLLLMLNEWDGHHRHIRLNKSLIAKYAEKLNKCGWYIDPRKWSFDDPFHFCWYATVERLRFYIAPSTYE
jgi:hypothetical protein